ncbi:MAG: efflux RND transporter permease subunit [Caldilineaceae bacterium]
MQGIEGVAAVDVNGGQVREIRSFSTLPPWKARRIAPQQVINAARPKISTCQAGSLSEGDQEFLVRTTGSFETVDEIRNVVISQRGAPVYLRDVATVEDGFETRIVHPPQRRRVDRGQHPQAERHQHAGRLRRCQASAGHDQRRQPGFADRRGRR